MRLPVFAFVAVVLFTAACDQAVVVPLASDSASPSASAAPSPSASASPTDTPAPSPSAAPSPVAAPEPTQAPPPPPPAPTQPPAPQPTAPPPPPPTAPPPPPPTPNPNGLSISGRVTDQTGASYNGVCITIGPPIRCATTTSGSGNYLVSLDSAPSGLAWDVRFLVSGTVKVERLGVVVSGPVTINATIAR